MESSSERARLAELLSQREASLTPNQRSLWAWDRLEPGHPALMLSSEWDLSCSGQVGPRLREAFAALARRHVNLRTLYPDQAGHPVPRLWTGELDFEEIDVPPGQWEAVLWAVRESPFDLEVQPPLRVRLLHGERLVLHFKLHHIACDWWSMLLLVEELTALLQGRTLAELEVDFPTYARWQSTWLEGPEPDRLLAEWRRELAPPRPDLRLPTDFPRPGDFLSGSLPLALPAALVRRLRALVKETRSSLSAVLLAGYSQALAQASGQQDVTVALPCSARWRSPFRNVLGPLYNILPLRLRAQGSWRARVHHSAEVLERALARQELPFPVLVEEMRPRRAHGAFPFTSAALSVLPYHEQWTNLQAGDLTARHVPQEFLVGPFDFTLNVLDSPDDLRLTLQFNAGLFEAQTAQKLADDLLEVFESSATERVFVTAKPRQHQRIEERFADAAARFPQRTAVVAAGREISFAELDKRATRLAGALAATPLEQPVGLQAYPSLESVVGWLAILKAGRICLPLDPELPPGRRQAMLADSGCQVILSPLGQADGSGNLAINAELGDPPRDSVAQRAEAAYLLYTSGSQGQPQGVLGSHQGLLHRCDALERHFPWQPGERALLRTPLGFVDAVAEWFGPLDGGATLCPFAQPQMVDSEELLLFLDQMGITRATLVPSLLGPLLRSKLPWPLALRVCVASGEVLRPDLVRDFYSRASFGAVLLNLYGSTECAGDVAWFDTRQLESGAASVPLGLPLGQSTLWVVDPTGTPLADGQEGEVLVGGPGLAHGYWKQAERTEKVFRNRLVGPDDAGPLLRTGDRGIWSRGLLEYLGRQDRTLKVRGWRVDLQEVEAVLESVPGVREAVVLQEEEGLSAWLGIDLGKFDATLLWNSLRQHLAPPLRPVRIRHLEALPRLPSGKIDRERLGDSEAVALRLQTGQLLSLRPEGPEQDAPWRAMAQLWEAVLKVPQVGPNDNFFDLGGHSLSAVELSHRIEEKFGRAMPPGLLVELPTVALLWAALQRPVPPVLLEMRAGDAENPLLCLIPGAWGGTIGFHKMVLRLNPEQPVVGLEFDGLESQDRVSLPAVAVRFASELARYRSSGPYILCGFSMGGLLAYEMAKILGNQVQHLILLDATGPGVIPETTPRWRNRLQEVWTHLQILARSRPRHVWDRLLKLPARRYRPSEQFDLAVRYFSEFQKEGCFEGPVTLIRMSYQPDWLTDPLLGWGELLPQLQTRTVVGLHGPLVIEEPVVDDVVAELERILRS